METAKVDIRKLQLLNDRINQCIDALNQVRISVHGLSHSPVGTIGTAPVTGYIDPRVTDPRMADPRVGYGISPTVPGYGGGLAHSPIHQIAGYPAAAGISAGNPMGSQIPIGVWNNAHYGLSHTTLEADPIYNRPLWADPLLAARVAQTFPFVQFALPPVVPVY
jgi:hypothetical protein